jgi:hypothetical protein
MKGSCGRKIDITLSKIVLRSLQSVAPTNVEVM